MRANQLRLYFSAFAYTLMLTIGQFGLAGTTMAEVQCGTIRSRLFKIAGAIKVSACRIVLSLYSVYPAQQLFLRVVANLQAAARASPAAE